MAEVAAVMRFWGVGEMAAVMRSSEVAADDSEAEAQSQARGFPTVAATVASAAMPAVTPSRRFRAFVGGGAGGGPMISHVPLHQLRSFLHCTSFGGACGAGGGHGGSVKSGSGASFGGGGGRLGNCVRGAPRKCEGPRQSGSGRHTSKTSPIRRRAERLITLTRGCSFESPLISPQYTSAPVRERKRSVRTLTLRLNNHLTYTVQARRPENSIFGQHLSRDY